MRSRRSRHEAGWLVSAFSRKHCTVSSFYMKSRMFVIDTSTVPATLSHEVHFTE